MSDLKVFAHLNPDTDSTVSPIAYAWFLSDFFETAATPYITGELNKETKFVLEHFEIETPDQIVELEEGDEVVILDTNNPDELPTGYDKATIVEIIDHHKFFGGLSTDSPIAVTMRPLGSSSTIVWQIMDEYEDVTIPANIAGLLLSGILSDTLNFTSPTTTDEDREAAEALAEIAGEDIDQLADQMFAAKSDLSGMEPKDVLTMDSKIFDMGAKVRISVLETTKPENAKEMTPALKEAMQTLKTEDGVEHVFFFVVDIINTEAHLLVATEEAKEVAKKAFGLDFEGDYMHLPGVVSRKKQMVPKFEAVL